MKRFWWLLVLLIVAILVIYLASNPRPGVEAELEQEQATLQDFELADVGFDTPESILYDADNDQYLVSNIAGKPLEKDGNGFISRVSPEGELLELKWIDGASNEVELNAPKGMAIVAGVLYVTDIDLIRSFDLATGTPTGFIGIEGASFLNDLVPAPGDVLYASDTGANQPGAVHVLRQDGELGDVAAGPELNGPNGLEVVPGALMMVTYGSNQVWRMPFEDFSQEVLVELPSGGLDGIEYTIGGDLLISSWQGKAVYRVSMAGDVETLWEGIPSPADIGYDATRNRVLIPVFTENRILVRSVPE